MNNTKSQNSKQDRTNQRQRTRQEQGHKKQGRSPNLFHDDQKPHDQEHPETRMTR